MNRSNKYWIIERFKKGTRLKYNSFDVYHMKHNYAQKWTVTELSPIQKRHFFEKSPFLFFLAIFAHFLPKTDFLLPNHLYWIPNNLYFIW